MCNTCRHSALELFRFTWRPQWPQLFGMEWLCIFSEFYLSQVEFSRNLSLELLGPFSWKKKKGGSHRRAQAAFRVAKTAPPGSEWSVVKALLHVGFLQSRTHTPTVRSINLKTPLMQRGATCWDKSHGHISITQWLFPKWTASLCLFKNKHRGLKSVSCWLKMLWMFLHLLREIFMLLIVVDRAASQLKF